MRRNYIKYVTISLVCLLIAACTEVDICESGIHPHIAKINVNYNSGVNIEDSMVVLSYRIVNTWRSGFILDEATGEGRSLYDSSDSIYKIDSVKNDKGAFYTKCGEICFTTFNYTTTNSNLALPNVLKSVVPAEHAAVRYKSSKILSLNNYAAIEPAAEGWLEYNSYTDKYLPAISEDVYYQTIMNKKIEEGAINNVDFSLRGVLQDIELKLNIKAEGVDVKKVVACVSGVPSAYNYFRETIQHPTYKTIFELQGNGSAYTGNMKVLGLVRSNSFTSIYGDGVLQIAVHTNNGKTYYALMNMFNAIDVYGDVIAGLKEKAILNIDAPLLVTPNGLVAQSPDMFADKWVIK